MKSPMAVILALFSLVFITCSSSGTEQQENDHTITLSGKVGFPQDGVIVLEKFQGNSTIGVDTVELADNYTYSTKVHLETPGYYRMNFYNKQFVNLILDKDDMEINVDGNNQQGFAEVVGSRDHDFIQKVQEKMQQMNASTEVQKLNQEFTEAKNNGDNEKMNEVRDQYLDMQDTLNESITQDIRDLGPSLGAIEILRNGQVLDMDKYFTFYKEYADQVEEAMPDSPYATEFVKLVRESAELSIGTEAPEIALPNPDGNVVKLSSLRGKYVLVDFWAKWCRPCRMENPHVVEMYNKYKDKGFEVYGVSLDRNREDWLEAIEADGLEWTQVSDLKFWNSEAAQTYHVTAIPFALLLDPDGKIIGKNLRGIALERKLAEIFKL